MTGRTEARSESELQVDMPGVVVEIARDVRAIADMLQGIAELSETGTYEVEPRQLHFADVLDVIGDV